MLVDVIENNRSINEKRVEEYWVKQYSRLLQKPVYSLFGEPGTVADRLEEGCKNTLFFTLEGAVNSEIRHICKNSDMAVFVFILSGLYILLSRYTGESDLVVGSVGFASAGQKGPGELLMLRNPIAGDSDIKVILDSVKNSVREAYKHQDIAFERVREKVLIREQIDLVDYFQVAFVYEGIQELVQELDKFTLLVKCSRSGEISLTFDRGKCPVERVNGLGRCFLTCLESMVKNPVGRVKEVDILDMAQRDFLLNTLNDTHMDIQGAFTVHEVFQQQVGQTPDRAALVFNDQVISYFILEERALGLTALLKRKGVEPGTVVGLLMEPSVEMIVSILGILMAGGVYLPIMPQYPQERIDYMLSDSGASFLLTDSPVRSFKKDVTVIDCTWGVKEERVASTILPCENLVYIIYTSGSTGRPKGVMVEHRQVVAYIRAFLKEFNLNAGDIVLQQSSYSFDVFVEEVFPVLSAGGKLAILGKGMLMEPAILLKKLLDYSITLITTTPPILDEINRLPQVKSIRVYISGGDILIKENVSNLLERGLVYNTYGPTETTVCASYYRYDGKVAPAKIPVGKPVTGYKIYILDNFLGLQPLGVTGELHIAGMGVTRGYLNDVIKTSNCFIANPFADVIAEAQRPFYPILYKTGDLGRVLWDGNIEFSGRKDSQVKIRGYRIELGEIENRLRKHPLIKEALVLHKKKSWKHPLICAYIVPGQPITDRQIKEYLEETLPGYMVPSCLVRLEKMPLTVSGKIDQQALPEPVMETGAEYEPPQNNIERQLCGIWEEILDVRPIGRNHHFFESGGHSLSAMLHSTAISKAFHITIPVTQLFDTPVLKDLAIAVSVASRGSGASLVPVEIREYYPVSHAQRRLFTLHRFEDGGIGYNIPMVFQVNGSLEPTRLEATFKQLIGRHESLRTSFLLLDEEPVQVIHDSETIKLDIEYFLHYENFNRESLQQLVKGFVRPFNLFSPPLLRVGLVQSSRETCFLLVDMHHIISDGLSLSILNREFLEIYVSPNRELPALPLQYKDYSAWQRQRLERGEIAGQEFFWKERLAGDLPVLQLPYDFPRPVVQGMAGRHFEFAFDAALSAALFRKTKETGTTLYMLMVSIYLVLLYRYSGQEDILVGVPIAGRYYREIENVIGMFVNTLPLRSFPTGDLPFAGLLEETKQNILLAFENQDYPFDELVEKLRIRRDLGRSPLVETLFNLQNLELEKFQQDDFAIGAYPFESGISKFDLSVIVIESPGDLAFILEYSTTLFKESTVQRFATHFKHIATAITMDAAVTLKDIDLLSKEEKEGLLSGFNRPYEYFQGKETIHSLFEKQVEQGADRVAVVYENQELTYRELNDTANQVAWLLRERGVGPNAIVGLMLERSLGMITAILGVLNAGGAYLPVEPRYPANRLFYMLDDADVDILITNGNEIREKNLGRLKGIEKERYHIYTTGRRPQISNLDGLPFPDRSLVNYEKYNHYIGLALVKNSMSIQASRGCPFNCAYCHKIWPKSHMVRSAENIFAEVQRYYKLGVRRFSFVDDIFNLDKKNSSRFFQMVIDNGLEIQVFFPNGVRGDLLTPGYIDLMIEAGTTGIAMALETASPRLQKLTGKNLNLERLRENLEYIAKKYPQVILELFVMLGFPTETQEEAAMTLEFVKSIHWLHFPMINVLKIYPNTEMERVAVENGISKAAIARSRDLAYHELPETLPFNKNVALQFQTDFLEDYFLSKERLLQVLPFQMKVLTVDEIVQKYDSYLPVRIKSFNDLLDFAGISLAELGNIQFLDESRVFVPDLNEKLKALKPHEEEPGDKAFRVLLLDLSQFFSGEKVMLYDVVEPPLGLMYLLTYLKRELGNRVTGRVAKSRIDFDSFSELKSLLEEFKPDVIGIRTLTFYKDFFHTTVSLVRQWGIDVPILAGGPYATSDYQVILQDRDIDIAVLGEGEVTSVEIIGKIIENNGKLPSMDVLEKIPGIAFVKIGEKDREYWNNRGRDILFLNEVVGNSDKKNITRTGFPEGANTKINQHRERHYADAGPDDMAYVIYTSGTTGNPKGVAIEHRNVVQLLHPHHFLFDFDDRDIWTLFHSYCFDFSVWEMYGALLYGGKLHIVHPLLTRELRHFTKQLKRWGVTVLNQTPSAFYHLSEEELKIPLTDLSLRYIIFGGEALSPGRLAEWRQKYGNIKLINMYGITETTVHSTYKEIGSEEITCNMSNIGFPLPTLRIYIMDEKMRLLPVGIPGELYVSGGGVGRGYLNQPEMTAAKFRPDPFYPGETIYRSGDLARWLETGEMEYLGRIDQQVKIRGFRIETGEIEKHLLAHENIKEVAVLAVETGEIEKDLVAYLVLENDFPVTSIREYLKSFLPDYMIPVHFIPLEKMPLTVNGKLDRKALPKPGERVTNGIHYFAPRNQVEERLVNLWKKILQVEVVGIHDNFFDLGGHSLRAMKLMSEIFKEFKVEIPLSVLFMKSTIGLLAQHVSATQKSVYPAIEPVEEKEWYPVSSAQRRMYALNQFEEEDGTGFNMATAWRVQGNLDIDRLEKAFKMLIERHEALRTSFHLADRFNGGKDIHGGVVQCIQRTVPFAIQQIKAKREQINESLQEFVKPFALDQAPLFRVGLINAPGESFLVLDMHHIIYDGTSVGILFNDLIKIYNGEYLQELVIQYKDFSTWQNGLFAMKKLEQQEKFWKDLFSGSLPVLNLPTDFPRPALQQPGGQSIMITMEKPVLQGVKNLANHTHGTLFMILMAAYSLLLAKYAQQEDIIVGTVTAGRPVSELENVVGVFLNTIATRNHPAPGKNFLEFLAEVKENLLKIFENQDYPFEVLVNQLELKRDFSRNPLYDTIFILQNFDINMKGELQDVGLLPYPLESNTFFIDLGVFALETEKGLEMEFRYATSLFKQESIERMGRDYLYIIQEILREPGQDISNIHIEIPVGWAGGGVNGDKTRAPLTVSSRSKQEGGKPFLEFRTSGITGRHGQTILDLFSAQAVATPGQISLYSNGLAADFPIASVLSYEEVDKLSNQLANYLVNQRKMQSGQGIGVLLPYTAFLPVAFLGILKAGGVYVPLNPSLPLLALKEIMVDAHVEMVISGKKYLRLLDQLQWECQGLHTYFCFDTMNITNELETEKNELMNEELWNYVVSSSTDDITAGAWASSYTGQPFSKAEMDEYANNIFEKLQQLLYPGCRVLEIGCSLGITMYRLAPETGLYYGVDISRLAIEANQERITRESPGQYQNIKLACLAAHEIDQVIEKEFDLVIMNSVIQDFHGYAYLRDVIRKAINLLGKQGYIFIGDIMDLEKKDEMIAELLAFKEECTRKGEEANTKISFNSELFFAREFWQNLGADLNEIESIEFSDKIHTIENELTRFRYDVLIKISKEAKEVVAKKKWKTRFQEDWHAVQLESTGALNIHVPLENPAAIFYQRENNKPPVSVRIDHSAFYSFFLWVKNHMDMGLNDRILLNIHYYCPGALWEMAMALTTGAGLAIWPGEQNGNGDELLPGCNRDPITILHLPANEYQVGENIKSGLTGLRYLFLGGNLEPADLTVPGEKTAEGYQCFYFQENKETGVLETLQEIDPLEPANEKLLSFSRDEYKQYIHLVRGDHQLTDLLHGPEPQAKEMEGVEKKLVKIWKDVLKTDQLDRDDNFFMSGGDSISAIQIVMRARQEGIHITYQDIFKNLTIAGILAHVIPARESVNAVEKLEAASEIPLTLTQLRLFTRGEWHGLEACCFSLRGSVDRELLEEAFYHVIMHHAQLRAGFIKDGKNITGRIHSGEDLDFYMEIVDLTSTTSKDRDEQVKKILRQYLETLDLENDLLIKPYFLQWPGDECSLLVAAHRLVIDHASWKILMEDLEFLYEHELEEELPRATASIAAWSDFSRRIVQKDHEDNAFWVSLEKMGKIKQAGTGVMDSQPPVMNASELLKIDEELTETLLYKIHRTYNTNLTDILLAALIMSCFSIMSRKELWVEMKLQDRETLSDELDISRTVGCLDCRFPVVFQSKKTIEEMIKDVKETLRRVPNHGLGFAYHGYVEGNQELVDLPTDVGFTFSGKKLTVYGDADLNLWNSAHDAAVTVKEYQVGAGATNGEMAEMANKLEVDCQVSGRNIEILALYKTGCFRPGTISSLLEQYTINLKTIANHCMQQSGTTLTASDFGAEKDFEQEDFEELANLYQDE